MYSVCVVEVQARGDFYNTSIAPAIYTCKSKQEALDWLNDVYTEVNDRIYSHITNKRGELVYIRLLIENRPTLTFRDYAIMEIQ